MGEFELRDYQLKLSKDAVLLSERINYKKGLFVQSQAGSGKTVIMADIAKKFTMKNKKVLFLAHRHSIIEQVQKTFIDYGIEMSLVKLKTIRTYYNDLFKRKKDFKPDLILVDEAHHAVSNTYMKVLSYYQKRSKKNKIIKQMFFTATPYRLDKKDFLSIADKDSIIYGPSTKYLIKHQYLAPFDYFEPKVMDLSKLKSNNKRDFTKKSIAKAGKSISGEDLVNVYRKYCTDEQALIYAASIESSKEYVKAFQNAGISAAHLDGNSSLKKRQRIIKNYKAGKIKILSNVELFTEGLDLPGASVAFLVRPTKSLSLYIQFSMRVLRYQDGKKAKIFDFADLHNRFGLPDTNYHWNLEGTPIKNKKDKTMVCPKCKCVFKIKNITWSVLCPNCDNEIWLRNSKTKSPLKRLSSTELKSKKEISILLEQIPSEELEKYFAICSKIPFNINFQLAIRDIGHKKDSSFDLIIKMLDSIASTIYPTEDEINKTLNLTTSSISRKSLVRLIKKHNNFINSILCSLQQVHPNNTLFQNFQLIKNYSQNDTQAITILFSIFREKRIFREYYAQEILNQNIKNIGKKLGIKKNSRIYKIIQQQEKMTTRFLSNEPPLSGNIFVAKVSKIKKLDKNTNKHRFQILFKDRYGKKEYSTILSNRAVFNLLSYKQQKRAVKEKDNKAYKLLNDEYLFVKSKQKENNEIEYDFRRFNK